MVTDLTSNYASPAGKEFTLVAGRYAGVSPSSTILDAGCGYGDGVCNLAKEFRCRADAIDINPINITSAQEQAEERRLSHLINFIKGDVRTHDFEDKKYDLVIAEGGLLSFLGRKEGLSLLADQLDDRGWLAFSDLILLTDEGNIPKEILSVFDHNEYNYENENTYRALLEEQGLDVHIMTLVPQSGWDNYYAHMVRRLDDKEGFFASSFVKEHFHHEIDTFYRLEGYRYVGYLFGLVRKR